jgi:Ca2+-binding RTX toxin-like protein
MAGRGGADTFVFNNDPNNGSNHDTIGDFNAAEGDRIALRDGAFPALTTGSGNPLGAGEFIANAGGNPTNGNQHIVYDTTTGNLFYDPDGNTSSGDKILIATLTGHPALTAAAFEIWS